MALKTRYLLIALAALAAAGVALLVAGSGDSGGPIRSGVPQVPGTAPNFLVLMTDDQTAGSFNSEAMPATTEFFDEAGVKFSDAIAAPPLCCPSRAGFLSGRYSQNTKVLENTLGYETLDGKKQTFPVALQAAGYETGMIGKFLNGYEEVDGAEPAPGFDRWVAINHWAGYRGFEVSVDGELEEVSEYSTDYLANQASEFIADSEDPFFLWLAFNAPHTVESTVDPCPGSAAQPRDPADLERFRSVPLPRGIAYDADTAGKPSLLGGPPPVGPRKREEMTTAWRCGLAAISVVDEQAGRLLGELEASGELANTVVIFLSDNGYFYGEHRLSTDKRLPLEPALRVPMALAVGEDIGGPETAGTNDALVSQVDLAPTILDYAGVDPCAGVDNCLPIDGHSLRPLLEDGDAPWVAGRAIPFALDDGWTYSAMRSSTELYLELVESRWRTFDPPAVEYYDLSRDPGELENLAAVPGTPAARLSELSAELAELSTCAGTMGQATPYEDRPYCP